jgi:hypothetical protein
MTSCLPSRPAFLRLQRRLIGAPLDMSPMCQERDWQTGREGQRGAEGHITFGSRLACCGICSMLWHMWHILDAADGQAGRRADGRRQTGSPSQLWRHAAQSATTHKSGQRVARLHGLGGGVADAYDQSAAAFAGLAGRVG